MAYTTVQAIKAYSKIDSSTDDALLETLIDAAQQIIDSYARRTFEADTSVTHVFDAAENVLGRTLHLDADLCAIDSIVNGNGATIDSLDYMALPRNKAPWWAIRLKRGSWTGDAIQVTGKWAYSTTPPADIVQACNRLVHWLYHQPEAGVDLDRALIIGEATVLPTRLPADVIQILAPYRRLI